MPIPQIFSLEHPITQNIIIQGVQMLGQWYLRRTPDVHADLSDRSIQKIDELINKLEKERQTNSRKQEEVETSLVPSHNDSNTDNMNNTSKDTQPSSPKKIRFNVEYSKPNTNQNTNTNIATACLPCTRAHLITVAGTLKEALRFARDEGLNSKEVLDRLDAAAEEIAVMERFDLAPEKIDNAPEHEKRVIREILLPQIRIIRQNIINNVKSINDLEELSVKAVELYKQARNTDIEEGINWGKVEEELKQEEGERT